MVELVMIKIVRGDIFEAPVDALVNPVNTLGVMGAGLAAEFKYRAPAAMFEHYQEACYSHELRIGRVLPYDTGMEPRWIIHFPTKDAPHNPSRLVSQVMHERLRHLTDVEILFYSPREGR